jgi:hypothetical protein
MYPECISTAGIGRAGVSSAGNGEASELLKPRCKKIIDAGAIAEPSTASFEEWITAVLAQGAWSNQSRAGIARDSY